MGDLAKIFAQEMRVEVWDDRNSDINFGTANVNQELIAEVKNFQYGKPLHFLEAAA